MDSFCNLCNEVIYYPTEHLLLFCRKTNGFRESLWPRLILKFGLNFFDQFISETPKGRLELLFSGCAKILNNETDIKDCVKIFVLTLGKIHSKVLLFRGQQHKVQRFWQSIQMLLYVYTDPLHFIKRKKK